MIKQKSLHIVLFVSIFFIAGNDPGMRDEVELVCTKKQSATQTCHYNFIINGEKYRFLDNGCKAKTDDVVKKAQQGKLALAKDWKIECPQQKAKPE